MCDIGESTLKVSDTDMDTGEALGWTLAQEMSLEDALLDDSALHSLAEVAAGGIVVARGEVQSRCGRR